MHPSLTTVAQPTADIGKAAMLLLLEEVKNGGTNEPPANNRIVLPTFLQVRESTKPMQKTAIKSQYREQGNGQRE